MTMKERIELTERHVKRRWLAATMTILLGGCMVGPDYQRPPVTTPGVFRGSPTPMAPDAQSIADLKWFEVFSDEQLQELIRTALVQNYDLRDAVARVDAARANLGITRSNQFPNFGFGAEVPSTELSTATDNLRIPRGRVYSAASARTAKCSSISFVRDRHLGPAAPRNRSRARRIVG